MRFFLHITSFFHTFAIVFNAKIKNYGTKRLDDCLQQRQDDGVER